MRCSSVPLAALHGSGFGDQVTDVLLGAVIERAERTVGGAVGRHLVLGQPAAVDVAEQIVLWAGIGVDVAQVDTRAGGFYRHPNILPDVAAALSSRLLTRSIWICLKYFLSTQVSLDGYAAGPDGDLDWTDVPDAEVDELMAEQLRAIDAMIFGHTTYRLLGPYWQDGPTGRAVDREHTALMNSVPKLVLSHGEPDLSWGPAKRIGADLPAEVAELKAGNGRPVAVFAGPQAANALLPYVDEVQVGRVPGRYWAPGLPLFTAAGPRMRLVQTRPFAASGAVQLRYRTLGAGDTGGTGSSGNAR